MDSKKTQKNAKKYFCEICDYYTCNKTDFYRHKTTDKHKNNENDSKMVVNDSKKTQKNAKIASLFKCECGKTYKYDSGFYRHKKMCKINVQNNNNAKCAYNNVIDNDNSNQIIENVVVNVDNNNINTNEKEDLILMLLKQNSELIELVKNGSNNINNCNNFSNNKTFNLQLFLNETCKDAMNITEFIDSIKLQLSDLEKVGELGYIEGISSIITKNLIALDITQRPIHCTDKKRDILYVKGENKWHKEDEDKKQIRNLIKRVSHKNINMIPKFKEAHPDCGTHDSKYSDQYNKIIIEAMGGKGDNNKEKEDKIIKNILKNVTIEKLK
jgi:hypothetical protein